MAKITLGGDRLGSGKKMEVNIPEFGRSSHDQGFVFTTDQAFGTLVPALCQIGTRGDVFYLDDITSLVRTLPTNGPVFGSVKQQIDVFMAPMRLYIGPLHNNMTGIGLKMNQIKMPVTEHITTVYSDDLELKNPNRASVAPDSLSSYLGSKGSRTAGNTGSRNVTYQEWDMFKLMYWDVYKNYYANKQEEEGVVINSAPKTEPNWQKVTIGQYNATNSSLSYEVSFTPDNNTTRDTYYIGDVTGATLKFQITYKKPVPISALLDVTIETTDGTYYLYNRGTTKPTGINDRTTYIKTIQNEKGNEQGDAKVWTISCVQGQGFIDSNLAKYPTAIFNSNQTITTTYINLQRFPLQNIDKMREAILAAPIGIPLVINKVNNGMAPYNVDTIQITDSKGLKREARSATMTGLGIKCHLSDIFNNWLQTDWIDGDNGINDLTSIDTTSGSFTINEFILDYKLFKMMNRIAISDGTYDAWQTAVYGQEGRVMTESPVYCGGYSSEIAFDEVVSNAATEGEPLGSLAGRGSQQGQTRKGGKNIKIKCDEAMLIMVLCSFTPRVTYSQGQAWWTNLESMDDLHKPDLDGIAFQNLNTASMAAWTQKADGTSLAVGKQPSWIEYTTEVNHVHGDFATGGPLEHMVINRTYQDDGNGQVANATTYIDPTEFNVIFADETLTAKPFWVQIGFDLTSRRKMSASQIPNL